MEKNQYAGYCRLSNTEGRLASMVPRTLRFDGKKHWPHCFSGYNSRHRCQQCKLMTNMFCIKCKVHLCCHGKRNCFTRFHTEDQYRDRVINLPTLSHSDSDQDTDVDEVETASAHSESEGLSSSF